jgi:hypothetical protein
MLKAKTANVIFSRISLRRNGGGGGEFDLQCFYVWKRGSLSLLTFPRFSPASNLTASSLHAKKEDLQICKLS